MNETQQLVNAANTVRDNFQARRILLLPRETAEEWSFDRLLSRGLEQRDRMRDACRHEARSERVPKYISAFRSDRKKSTTDSSKVKSFSVHGREGRLRAGTSTQHTI